MIVNVSGVILSRRALGEYDRICVIFTESMGRMVVRFSGVNKAAGKLKALSEPMCWGDYRLHISNRGEFAKVIGGRIQASFPSLRTDLGRTLDALACCQMLERLTPERLPSSEKFRLLCATLNELEQRPNGWVVPAFGLRLAELLGISLRERGPQSLRRVWQVLHDGMAAEVAELSREALLPESVMDILTEHFTAHAGRPMFAIESRSAWFMTESQGTVAC